jgi:transcriptional regulator with XRE-family HTH domain
MDELNYIGANIKKERKKKFITQKELIEKSGVSKNTVTLLETQRATDIRLSSLLKLAKALEVDVVKFFNN